MTKNLFLTERDTPNFAAVHKKRVDEARARREAEDIVDGVKKCSSSILSKTNGPYQQGETKRESIDLIGSSFGTSSMSGWGSGYHDYDTLTIKIGTTRDINTKDSDGNTLLSLASHYGNIARVKSILLYKKIDVNTTNNYGNTPLTHAAIGGHLDIVILLLKDSNLQLERHIRKINLISQRVRNLYPDIFELIDKDMEEYKKSQSVFTKLKNLIF